MENSIVIKIGPLVANLVFDEDLFYHFGPFLEKYVVKETPVTSISFLIDHSLDAPDFDGLYFSKDLSPIITKDLFEINTFFARAKFDFSSKSGKIYLPDSELVSRYGVFMFMQVIFSILLLDYDALLVHSAGIVNNGKAYLFPARSGVGKTTLSLKAKEAKIPVLADDCVGIDVKNKTLFSTFFKFHYDILLAPFECCAFLAQSDSLKVTILTTKEASYLLLNSNHLLLYLKEKAKPYITKLIKLSFKALNEVSTVRLESRLEDDIKVIFNELEKNR